METRLSVVETQLEPVWKAAQSIIIADLTHPSPQFEEMDDLLHKLGQLTLTATERTRLHVLLIERISSVDPEITEDERDSAKLLKGIMKKVLGEAAASV